MQFIVGNQGTLENFITQKLDFNTRSALTVRMLSQKTYMMAAKNHAEDHDFSLYSGRGLECY